MTTPPSKNPKPVSIDLPADPEPTPEQPKRDVPPPPTASNLLILLIGFLILSAIVGAACLAFVLITKNRQEAEEKLTTETQKMSETTVLVTHPELGSTTIHLVLPGSAQALRDSSVYARVNGYLKRWLVDIGTPVKEGQLLAEIDTPETDQQYAQAQATVAQNAANLKLSESNAQRYNELMTSNSVSKQEVDSANDDLSAKRATLAASQAEMNRLQQIESFKQVYAPFDGVITRRGVEVGNLINAGAGSQELFHIAQTSTLRVFVAVPEAYAALAKIGIVAQVFLASSPNEPVAGTLTRTSDSIDPNSLTLVAEVDVPNPSLKLLTGGYAQVHFDLESPKPPLVIPGNTVLFRSQGTQVGIVDPSTNTVHLRSIKIGRDFGAKVEVVSDLSTNDLIILNPSDSLTDGMKVHVTVQPSPSAAPTPTPSKP